MFPEELSKGKEKSKVWYSIQKGSNIVRWFRGGWGLAAARSGGSGGNVLALANGPASSQNNNSVNIQYHGQMETADDLMLNPTSLLPQLAITCIIDALEESHRKGFQSKVIIRYCTRFGAAYRSGCTSKYWSKIMRKSVWNALSVTIHQLVMEYHLKHQCKNYCCPKCVEREQIDSSTSHAKLKTHTTLAI